MSNNYNYNKNSSTFSVTVPLAVRRDVTRSVSLGAETAKRSQENCERGSVRYVLHSLRIYHLGPITAGGV